MAYAKYNSPWNCGQCAGAILSTPNYARDDSARQRRLYWDTYMSDYTSFNAEYCMVRFKKPWWETSLCYAIDNNTWAMMRLTLNSNETTNSPGTSGCTCQLAQQDLLVGLTNQQNSVGGTCVFNSATPLTGGPWPQVQISSRERRRQLDELIAQAQTVARLMQAVAQRTGMPAAQTMEPSLRTMSVQQSQGFLSTYSISDGLYTQYPQTTYQTILQLTANGSSDEEVYGTLSQPSTAYQYCSVQYSELLSTFCNSAATPYIRLPNPDTSAQALDIVLISSHQQCRNFSTHPIATVTQYLYFNQSYTDTARTQVYGLVQIDGNEASLEVMQKVQCFKYATPPSSPSPPCETCTETCNCTPIPLNNYYDVINCITCEEHPTEFSFRPFLGAPTCGGGEPPCTHIFFPQGYLTTIARKGLLVSLRLGLAPGAQELLMSELPTVGHQRLATQFTYTFQQPCLAGTQLLLTPEVSSGEHQADQYRQFYCEPSVMPMNVMLYSGDNLQEALAECCEGDNCATPCSCIGHANQGILNNHILVRLPPLYVNHLRSNNQISELVYSRYGVAAAGGVTKLLSFVPVPLVQYLSTLTGSRVQVVGYNTSPFPPSFTDEMIAGLTLPVAGERVPIRPQDALFTLDDIQRLMLISSVIVDKTIQGGMWVIDNEIDVV
jgi:hypothetical protein